MLTVEKINKNIEDLTRLIENQNKRIDGFKNLNNELKQLNRVKLYLDQTQLKKALKTNYKRL